VLKIQQLAFYLGCFFGDFCDFQAGVGVSVFFGRVWGLDWVDQKPDWFLNPALLKVMFGDKDRPRT